MSDNTVSRWKHDGVQVIPGGQLDANTAADARHGAQGGDQLRTGRRPEALGRYRQYPRQRQDRRASPWRARKRHLRVAARHGCAGASASSSPPKPGRATSSMCRPSCRIRRSTPAGRGAGMRAGAQRQRGRRGQSRHRAGRDARAGAAGSTRSTVPERPHPIRQGGARIFPGQFRIGRKSCAAIVSARPSKPDTSP